ncbi:MAG: carboxypeptidase regulatory-like domain-containing protein [Desulfurococcales archaeon]|nr:carboxypeptidase regulatory-like domain-containing protein [Desulfurococcales archaeon]
MSVAYTKLREVLCVVALTCLVIAPLTHLSSVQAANTSELLSKYGEPLVVPLQINLSSVAAVSIDASRNNILLAGERDGVTVATLIDSNYFEKQGTIYPIFGAVSSFDMDDTYSPTFYAFGSSEGEVLVLSPRDLSLVFKYVQGDEFRISKVCVSKNILAAMFEGSRSFIKVFNLSSGGWSELGEVVGNAPRYSMEDIKIVDFSMLKFAYGDKIGTKDTMVVAYFPIPANKLLIQVINASTSEPLASAVVYVRNDVIGTVYQGVTDREGYALVPVDLVGRNHENLTVFVKVGSICYEYTFTNVKLQVVSASARTYTIGKVIKVPGGVVSSPPQVVRKLILDISDVSTGVPRRIRALNRDDVISLKIHAFLDVSVLKQKFRYILVVSGRFASDPSCPSLRIIYLDTSFNVVGETSYRLFSDVTSFACTPDGKFIVVGTQGGVIYILRIAAIGGKYEVIWGYRLPHQITSITVSSSANSGIAVIAGDEGGDLQVLYLPTANEMIPILRVNLTLSFSTHSPITSLYATSDLNTIIVGTASRPYLILGLGDYILRQGKPIDLSTRELHPLTIYVTTANGTAVANAKIEVYSSRGTLVAEGRTDTNGTYIVDYIIPGTYRVLVQPPVDYLEKVSELVQVTKEVREIVVTCNYTAINVHFSILDSETREEIEESVDLTISGPETFMKYEVTNKNSSFYLKLLPGRYKISVTPNQYVVGKPLYQELTTYINVPNDRNVTLYLARNTFRLTLRFIDNETRGPPREPVQAVLYKGEKPIASSIISAYKNTLTLLLRDKGVFTLEVRPLPPPNEEPYFIGRTYTINVTSDTQEVIFLYLNRMKLTLNITDKETSGPPLTSIKIMLDGKYAATVPANTSYVVLEVAKGSHTITLVPMPEYSYLKIPLYNVTRLDVRVVKKSALSISLERVYMKVVLKIWDHYTGGGPAEKIILMINGNKVAEINPNASAPVLFTTYLHVGENVIQLKGKNIYADFIKKVNIVNATTIDIELLRKLFTLKIVVVNDIGQKLSGGIAEARGINLKFEATSSIVDGEVYLKLPFGMYTIEVAQPGYEKYVIEKVVDHDEEISVVLYPKLTTLLIRYLPVIVGVSVIAAIIALIFKYRAKIKSLITPEEELF